MDVPARLRVIVVDDEVLTRASLAARLERLDGVAVVGQAGNIEEARELIGELEPDALFVDILMPGGSGLDLAPELGPETAVVFVTAHADFAADAFDLDAADYLTKPVRPERLEEAVERVRRALLRRPDLEEPVNGPQDILADGEGHVSRFVIRRFRRVTLIPVEDLLWAESAANYVKLHTLSGTHLLRSTLAELDAALDPSRFRRIHRSALVSLAEVEEITSDGHGAYEVRLRSGPRLRMTRTYRTNLIP